MDGARKSTRKFPGYTTKELESFVAAGLNDAELKKQIEQEIADRKSGKSVAFHTPQIEGGKIQTKVGRM